jgi:hypothetical protein
MANTRDHSANDETLAMGQTRTDRSGQVFQWIHDSQLK